MAMLLSPRLLSLWTKVTSSAGAVVSIDPQCGTLTCLHPSAVTTGTMNDARAQRAARV